MPARVVRGEINASESLSRVSLEANLTFRALISAVDDFGRMDARPNALKAALFPMHDSVRAAQIVIWIVELHEEGCVQLYEVDGRQYVQLVNWEKHRGQGKRASRSRIPEPPEGSRIPRVSVESMESPGDPRIPVDPRESPGSPPSERLVLSEKREALDEKSPAPDGAPLAKQPDGDQPKPDHGLVLVESTPKRESPAVPPDAAKFTEDFLAALVRIHSGFKPPTPTALDAWRQEARRMFAIDKRPVAEARHLAAWLFTGSDEGAVFWRGVVLSVPKFREKYDQMLVKARATHERGQGAAHHGSALLAWANS